MDILKLIPKMSETLSEKSMKRFDALLGKMNEIGIKYYLDNSIVRGLDYYNDTVFEWRDNNLGSQNAICAGGRYDSLIENTGGNSVPAVGFALGMERIVELIKSSGLISEDQNVTIPIMSSISEEDVYNLQIATMLRNKYPNIRFFTTDSSASISSQIKNALKLNDNFIISITTENIKDESITVKMKENKMNDTILSKDELFQLMDKLYE